jgi:hypothetical protein
VRGVLRRVSLLAVGPGAAAALVRQHKRNARGAQLGPEGVHITVGAVGHRRPEGHPSLLGLADQGGSDLGLGTKRRVVAALGIVEGWACSG